MANDSASPRPGDDPGPRGTPDPTAGEHAATTAGLFGAGEARTHPRPATPIPALADLVSGIAMPADLLPVLDAVPTPGARESAAFVTTTHDAEATADALRTELERLGFTMEAVRFAGGRGPSRRRGAQRHRAPRGGQRRAPRAGRVPLRRRRRWPWPIELGPDGDAGADGDAGRAAIRCAGGGGAPARRGAAASTSVAVRR
ncbi:MAG: hypothetical protein U5R31_10245 [Acidimicrobiia bacterium]|nr:hypothetical protein [Acidimicrobiia bacterium]